VLRTGIPWEYLPAELGWGSGMTCWRRLRDWNAAGVWHQLHLVLLDRLGQADRIDWQRASLDSASVRAKKGAAKPKRSGRVLWTAARQAPNTTSWSMAVVSR
jgi:transposase